MNTFVVNLLTGQKYVTYKNTTKAQCISLTDSFDITLVRYQGIQQIHFLVTQVAYLICNYVYTVNEYKRV